jgi:hypothetical protein
MHFRHRPESGFDSSLENFGVAATGPDFDKRAEQWTASAKFNV